MCLFRHLEILGGVISRTSRKGLRRRVSNVLLLGRWRLNIFGGLTPILMLLRRDPVSAKLSLHGNYVVGPRR